MNSDKYCFIHGLKRKHANLILGFNGKIYDHQLLGFLTVEATTLSPNTISVKKLSNIWYVSSEYDWIKDLCDDESYLFDANYLPHSGLFYHLSGCILSAFSNGVGLALNGKITTSYNLSDDELENIKLEILNLENRTVFFKSVEA